jgi:predicted DNA-binding ribbon-helix-helix protein
MRPNINRKRSVVVSKKRTSVSLEDSFWFSLQAIVRMENTTIEHYIERIEQQRETPNLSSNLRIAVLEYFQQLAASNISPRYGTEAINALGRADDLRGRDREAQLADKVTAFWGKRRDLESQWQK